MRAAFSFAFVAVNALCGFFAQASPTLSRNGELGLRGVSAEGPSLSKRTVTYSATITARNYDTGAAVSDIGYLGPYYEFVTSSTSATVFSFTLPTGATSGTGVRLTAVSGSANSVSFPYLGLAPTIQGNAVIQPNHPTYLLLTGISTPTVGGAPPQYVQDAFAAASGFSNRQVATDIWTVDVTAGTLSAVWINPDGSVPSTTFSATGSLVVAYGGPVHLQGTRITFSLNLVEEPNLHTLPTDSAIAHNRHAF